MPIAISNGLQISYEVVGSGDPVVFLAGTSADSSMWLTSTMTYLSHRRSLLVDPRDTPKSDEARGQYTTGDLASDVVAVMDAAAIDAAHVVGYSLGGAVAQEIAAGHSERVLSLALVCTWGTTDAWLKHLLEWLFRGLQVSGSDWADDAILWLTLSPRFQQPDLYEGLKTFMSMRGQSQDALSRQLECAMAHDAKQKLPTISCPTLVVAGDVDVFVPMRYSRELAELIPNSRLHLIEGAAHGLPIEMADEFFLLLDDWIKATGARA